MSRILITGMSGTGKSSVIEVLKRRGASAIDTDSDEWCEWALVPSGEPDGGMERDWVWREGKMRRLLVRSAGTTLFVSGCKSNQGRLYDLFEQVVLLSAPLEVLLARIARRSNNPYGKSQEERDRIVRHVHSVEPLLRRSATSEIDTSSLTVPEVADRLIVLSKR